MQVPFDHLFKLSEKPSAPRWRVSSRVDGHASMEGDALDDEAPEVLRRSKRLTCWVEDFGKVTSSMNTAL